MQRACNRSKFSECLYVISLSLEPNPKCVSLESRLMVLREFERRGGRRRVERYHVRRETCIERERGGRERREREIRGYVLGGRHRTIGFLILTRWNAEANVSELALRLRRHRRDLGRSYTASIRSLPSPFSSFSPNSIRNHSNANASNELIRRVGNLSQVSP